MNVAVAREPVPDGLLIVRGDEDKVPFSDLAFGYVLGQRGGLLLVTPSREMLIEHLLVCQAFLFYGHGDKGGALHLGRNEFLRQTDLMDCLERRSEKLDYAEIRACYSAKRGVFVNRWLDLAHEFRGFPDVTASAAPPFVHPMHTYRTFIEFDPGAKGVWSRFTSHP